MRKTDILTSICIPMIEKDFDRHKQCNFCINLVKHGYKCQIYGIG